MPTQRKTATKKSTEKFPHPIDGRELAVLQGLKAPRPEWDAAAADAAASEFAKTLTPKMTAKELIAAMKPFVSVSGWKRLIKAADGYFSSK